MGVDLQDAALCPDPAQDVGLPGSNNDLFGTKPDVCLKAYAQELSPSFKEFLFVIGADVNVIHEGFDLALSAEVTEEEGGQFL